MFELYIWGPLGDEFVSFHPECIAAIWYLSIAHAKTGQEFVIYQSSNPHISANGQLPAIRHSDSSEPAIGGLFAVIQHLKDTGYDIDEGLKEKAKCEALTEYIRLNVNMISLYTLYVQRQNFEDVVRPLFTKLIPFPMQYVLPIQQRNAAKHVCSKIISEDNEDQSGKGKSDQTRQPLSRLEEQVTARSRLQESAFSNARENVKALMHAKQVYENIRGVSRKDPQEGFLFDHTTPTTADIILAAHLNLQLSSKFPVPIVKTLLETQFPELVQYAKSSVQFLTEKQILNIQPTKPEDRYTLTNMAYHKARQYLPIA